MGFKYPYTDFHELNLDWVIEQIKALSEDVDALNEWKSQFEEDYEELHRWIEIINSGNLPPAMEEGLLRWAEAHIQDLVGAVLPTVFFEITEDGYFAAYVPASWEDVHFGTSGLDDFPVGVDYGHLTLIY